MFKVVSQGKNSLIVESLVDGRKLPVFATDRSSSLEDISIFTRGEDMPLQEVLYKIFEKEEGKPSIDPKETPAALTARFEEILPEYDKDRVYLSDIKKVFSWYALLLEKGLITKPSDEENETVTTDSDQDPKTIAEDKVPKKVKLNAGADRVKTPQVDGKHSKMEAPKRRTMQKK